MANQSVENVKGLFKNKSTRVVMILTFAVIAAGIIAANMMTTNQQSRPKDLQAVVGSPSVPDVISTPGTSDNVLHNKKIQELNRREESVAEKTGDSTVPRLVNKGAGLEKDPFDLITKKGAPDAKSGEIAIPVPVAVSVPKAAPVPAPTVPAPQMPVAPVQKSQASVEAEKDMAKAMAGLLNSWIPSNQRVEVGYAAVAAHSAGPQGVAPVYPGQSASSSIPAGSPVAGDAKVAAPPKKVAIKAGSILHAVIITSVNSDEPGPVLAQIVAGPYSGGRLMGTFSMTSQDPKLVLVFKTLTMQTADHTYDLDGYAVDPGTARTALASDVDNHYLSRYGMFTAATFLKGYSKALTQSGSTTMTTVGVGGVSSQTTYPEMTNKQMALSALGEVGTEVAGQLKGGLNRPPTVTLNSGVEIGVLIMKDATF